MYIRTTTRTNKNGSITEYVRLAHNVCDKESKHSTVKVLLNFGRKEDIDVKGLERLVLSIQKYIGFKTRHELQKLSLVSLQLPEGFVNQTSESTVKRKVFSQNVHSNSRQR